MADRKKKKAAGIDIDWYLISIDRLKQIGLVVLILLLGGGAWWFYAKNKGTPRYTAESAISDARQALNSLAASSQLNAHRAEFDRASKKLDDAGAHFTAGRFAEAQGAAVESQTISRTALSGGDARENDAQFLTVEGDVQYQKSTGEWKRADARTPLFSGDWVKTGDDSSAELIFSNGSLYTIGQNALLEIYATISPSTSKKTNAVQMKVGSVEVATSDDVSTVRTPGTQVVVDSESTTQVGVNKTNNATSVVSMKGSATVQPTAGGEVVKLASGEKVSATEQGSLSPVKKLALPPGLQTPPDNAVFPLAPGAQVEFSWQAQAGAGGYQLQVSRSRLFTTLEINAKRQKTAAKARVTSEGAFYWRVASIGPDGEVGPFSPFRRFRVSGGGRGPSAVPGDTTPPPKLQLKAPFSVGSEFYIIEGMTDPGSTVFINDEEVDVESNGHFKKIVSFKRIGRNVVVVKAVSPSGVQTVQSQTVLVEE
ncbi:MAG TPA: FecR domain-containing protein [Thermoanaerobaculia bacterium]|nr:FecR domain-containing protein [Thermoanaerobaculia bacterium]